VRLAGALIADWTPPTSHRLSSLRRPSASASVGLPGLHFVFEIEVPARPCSVGPVVSFSGWPSSCPPSGELSTLTWNHAVAAFVKAAPDLHHYWTQLERLRQVAKVLRPNLCLKHRMSRGRKPALTSSGQRSRGS
jgi:hypothetical protein